MSKRQRYLLSTLAVTIFMILVTIEDNLSWKYGWLGLMVTASVGGIIWSLWENLIGIVRVMILILPGLLSLGAGIFAFLLPSTIPAFSGLGWGGTIGNIL